MNLEFLLNSAGCGYPHEADNIEIESISSDSRTVTKNSLFVCIKGMTDDGHRHAERAVLCGAVAIVAQKQSEIFAADVPIIWVEDTRRALARLFSAWYGHPESSMKLIGVTGTNGKTTVSQLVCKILRASGRRCGLIGTAGCMTAYDESPVSGMITSGMTTPEPAELYAALAKIRDSQAEYTVMEITSHSILQNRIQPLEFEAGIFTNLTPEHLDVHNNMESYFETKAKLFRKCKFAVINTSDAYGRRLYDMPNLGCRAVSCSKSPGADYTAQNVNCDGNGIRYIMSSNTMRIGIRSQITGQFNIMNTLQAAACSAELGITAECIRTAISGFSGVSGRMERVQLDGADFSVFIDYAHTPDALENLLLTVRGFRRSEQRIVLLFGCGGNRDRSKRAVMGEIASRLADFVIVTSDNSRGEQPTDIITDILDGFSSEREHTVIVNRREAIKYAINKSRPGDIILLAGKGHENYEIDADGKHPFCERDIVIKTFTDK